MLTLTPSEAESLPEFGHGYWETLNKKGLLLDWNLSRSRCIVQLVCDTHFLRGLEFFRRLPDLSLHCIPKKRFGETCWQHEMMCVLTQTALSLGNLACSYFTVAFLGFKGEKGSSLTVCFRMWSSLFSNAVHGSTRWFPLSPYSCFLSWRPKWKGAFFFYMSFST